MNKFRFTINTLAIAIFMFAFASIAQAQATRTWVSGVGDDANPCSRTAPCKTFAGAISKTANCGEIDALDPGGFGAVTITKGITLDGTGTLASILAAGTNAIIINATNSDVVTIRGLTINGACTGVDGIRILQARTVNIEDCVVFRFATGHGVNATDGDGLALNIRNTVIRDNTNDGVQLNSTGASPIQATLENCSLNGNANGLHAKNKAKVTVRNCVISNNGGNGIFAEGVNAGTVANVKVWASQITLNSSNGIAVGNAGNAGTSFVELAQNQINFNTGSGVLVNTGGAAESFSNNSIRGNGSDGCAMPNCQPVGPGN